MSSGQGPLWALARAVRARRASAVEVVEAALRRIEQHNPALGAVVALRGEEALAEAQELDVALASGEKAGPLAGVPLLVKDCEDVTGMRTTWASRLLAGSSPAASDGLIPRRLRAAGAIVVGKTNLPEFTFEGYTANVLFGVTRNPWAPQWSPGGSSGGSAAAMAAGLAPVATATDGGGSIRIPASFCGLVGIKPTAGVIPRDPIPYWMDLSTDGPLAQSVDDLRLLLSLESGPAAGDPTALPSWAGSPPRASLPRNVLAAPRWCPWGPLPDPVQTLFEQALSKLERALGVSVTLLDPADIFASGNPDADWHLTCSVEHLHHLGKEVVEANADAFDPVFLHVMRGAMDITVEQYLAARRRRFAYVKDLDQLLGEDGVIVMPTMAVEGFTADGRVPGADRAGTPASAYNTQIQNITGHPAITVPAGRLPNGVCFGLQFTAPRFRDDMLLDLAAAWEKAEPWPLVAPGYSVFEV